MTEPYYADDSVTLYAGDCLAVLPTLPDNSVDAVVTDPPYELTSGKRGGSGVASVNLDSPYGRARIGTGNGAGGFMGKAWDATGVAFDPETWRRVYRVMKPGGHLLAFGGTRTWHRLAVAIEDAGFEIRDTIAWLYGSGFPKSLDVSKAIDKRRDWTLVERLSGEIRRARIAADLSLAEIGQATMAVTGDTYGKWYHRGGHMFFETGRSLPSRPEWEQLRHVLPIAPEFAEVYDEAEREVLSTKTTTRAAQGWAADVRSGMFQSGDREVTITAPATADAQRWQGWGTALKPAHEPIVVARKPLVGTVAANVLAWGTGALNIDGCRIGTGEDVPLFVNHGRESHGIYADGLQGSNRTGETATHGRWPANVALDETAAAALDHMSGETGPSTRTARREYDAGIYGPKRQEGDAMGHADSGGASRYFYTAKADSGERITHNGVAHPTVKPLSLMRWLVRLVTPPCGVILEPFAGSGTTIEAALIEGFRCIAIEREADYLPLITQRINRRLDPIAYLTTAGEDLGLFGDSPA